MVVDVVVVVDSVVEVVVVVVVALKLTVIEPEAVLFETPDLSVAYTEYWYVPSAKLVKLLYEPYLHES